MYQAKSKIEPTSPLRVLHVASGDLWAGAEVQIVHLLKALNSQDSFDLRVVLMNEGVMADQLRQIAIPVNVLDEGRHGVICLWHNLRSIVRAWRPAVVHTHRRKEHLLGALAAWGTGARLAATCHGRSEQFPGQPTRRSRVLESIQWSALRHFHDRVVAVSDELAEHVPLPPHQVEVICNGIDPEDITRAARDSHTLPVGNRGIKLAFIGRLVPVKQINHLILAMQALENMAPGQFTLYIIGDGPLRLDLETLADQLGLGETVQFLGFQANPIPTVALMDAVVFSSLHEGLPMTALEALALGVPVIAPPVGGLVDLLSSSPLGILSASDKPNALADAILSLTNPMPRLGNRDSAFPGKYLLSTTAGKYRALYFSLASPE